MRWSEAVVKLQEMLDEGGLVPEYVEAIEIAIERLKEIQDLEDEVDPK